MTTCRGWQKAFFDLLAGDLDERGRRRLDAHCETCRACREERDRVALVLEGAASARRDLAEASAGVDWSALPGRITDAVFRAERERADRRERRRFFGRLHPVLGPASAVLGGAALGAVATWLILHPAGTTAPGARAGFHAPAEIMERAESEMARRETVEFLRKSRYLLMDFVEGDGAAAPADDAVRDVLAMKRYLDPHLGEGRMAQAQALCDQIEMLVLELARVREAMSPQERGALRDLIRDRRVLLKINLVESELRQSES